MSFPTFNEETCTELGMTTIYILNNVKVSILQKLSGTCDVSLVSQEGLTMELHRKGIMHGTKKVIEFEKAFNQNEYVCLNTSVNGTLYGNETAVNILFEVYRKNRTVLVHFEAIGKHLEFVVECEVLHLVRFCLLNRLDPYETLMFLFHILGIQTKRNTLSWRKNQN